MKGVLNHSPSHSHENSDKDGPKKESAVTASFSLSFITIAFVIMAGIGVFGLNYWHSVRCHEAHTSDEIDIMYKSLLNRVLEAESAAWASTIELEQFISVLAEELANVEDKELHKLKTLAHAHHRGKGGAIETAAAAEEGGMSSLLPNQEALARVQLALASTPSPLKHRFHLEPRLAEDPEALADRINGILTGVVTDEFSGRLQGRAYDLGDTQPEAHSSGSGKRFNTFNIDVAESVAESVAAPPSQAETARQKLQDDDFLYIPDPLQARANNVHNHEILSSTHSSSKLSAVDNASAAKTCALWKAKYDVRIGVSWGSLPYDLQERWLKINCDHIVLDAGEKAGIAAANADTASVAGEAERATSADTVSAGGGGEEEEQPGDGQGQGDGEGLAHRRRLTTENSSVSAPTPARATSDAETDASGDDDFPAQGHEHADDDDDYAHSAEEDADVISHDDDDEMTRAEMEEDDDKGKTEQHQHHHEGRAASARTSDELRRRLSLAA